MKTLILILLVSTLDAKCWKIKDRDTKALCTSQYENKKDCWKIKDKDKKAYCEAVAYGRNSCGKIRDKDMRAMCRASIK